MTVDWLPLILAAATVASAVVAGVFLTFSDFVMGSLAAAKPEGGIESMQIINRKVTRTLFMVLLLGLSALSPPLIGAAALFASGPAAVWIATGGTLYLVGVFLVSIVFNVPMNRRLDAMDPDGPEAAAYWPRYVPRWRFWNSVRALSAGGAGVCFLMAIAG
ncbi:MAG: anthrone oxygenase family protein [Pseudomonadota bacterium]